MMRYYFANGTYREAGPPPAHVKLVAIPLEREAPGAAFIIEEMLLSPADAGHPIVTFQVLNEHAAVEVKREFCWSAGGDSMHGPEPIARVVKPGMSAKQSHAWFQGWLDIRDDHP